MTIPDHNRRHRRAQAGAVFLAIASAAVVLAGCSSDTKAPAAAPPSSALTTTPAPPITSPTTIIGGHTYTVPTDPGGRAVDSAVDQGGQVILTDKGFLPFRTFANLKQKITWTNLSSHPVTISFYDMHKSWNLPVGGTFTYSSPTLINFRVTSSSGYASIVAIGAFPS